MTISATTRPALAAGTRLQADRARGGQVLLHPEGVLLLSPTAAAVLALCDGRRDVAGIVAVLGGRYRAPADHIGSDVADLLLRLCARGLVRVAGDDWGGES